MSPKEIELMDNVRKAYISRGRGGECSISFGLRLTIPAENVMITLLY